VQHRLHFALVESHRLFNCTSLAHSHTMEVRTTHPCTRLLPLLPLLLQMRAAAVRGPHWQHNHARSPPAAPASPRC
jgi:hypothetical protein